MTGLDSALSSLHPQVAAAEAAKAGSAPPRQPMMDKNKQSMRAKHPSLPKNSAIRR